MGSLYIVRGFVDDLQSVVQLPTMISSSCEWKPKDLAVAQSHKASRQRRERVYLCSPKYMLKLFPQKMIVLEVGPLKKISDQVRNDREGNLWKHWAVD